MTEQVIINPQESKKSGAFATTALVAGIVAVVLGWTGPVGLVLAIVAITFGVLAVVKKQSTVKSVWGIALGGVALIIAIIAISLASAVVDALNDSGSSSTGTGTSETAPASYTVGQAIDFDGKKVTVTSVERNWQSGNEYIVADSGNEYVKVQVAIENNSNSRVSYDTFDWKIQDSKGVIQDVDINTYSVDGGLNGGELAPDGKVSGFMVFQVPAEDSGLVISYNPSFFGDKKIEIKL